jgi:dipeptidyl aminopeptidase/acylaminoacyl peptidase
VVATMHLSNLTSSTGAFNDLEPAESPDGGSIAYAGDRDMDFEIYIVANVFTGEVQQVTDKMVDNRKPAWSSYGQRTIYQASRSSSPPTQAAIFLEAHTALQRGSIRLPVGHRRKEYGKQIKGDRGLDAISYHSAFCTQDYAMKLVTAAVCFLEER